jgi:UDP-4-amino-4,6-dideoxy-L-N-acetyl-beta-L-altrosamine transaminase
MREKKIGLQVHYRPINKQPYYKNIGYGDEQTPMMDRYFQECLSIPCYPLLSEDEQQYVINSLLEVLNV